MPRRSQQVPDKEAFLHEEALGSVERATVASQTVRELEADLRLTIGQVGASQVTLDRDAFPGVGLGAWEIVMQSSVVPAAVFANLPVLERKPILLQWYRLVSGLSRKAMGRISQQVDSIERGKSTPTPERLRTRVESINLATSLVIEQFASHQITNDWLGERATGQLVLQLHGKQSDKKGDIWEQRLRRLLVSATQGRIVRYYIGTDEFAKAGHETSPRARLLNRHVMLGAIAEITQIELNNGAKIVFTGDPDVTVFRPWDVDQPVGMEVKSGTDRQNSKRMVVEAAGSLRRLKAQYPRAYGVVLLRTITDDALQHVEDDPSIDDVLNLDHLEPGERDHEKFATLLGMTRNP